MDIGLKSKPLELTFEVWCENLFPNVCLNFLNTPESASIQFLGWMYFPIVYCLVGKNKFLFAR